MKFSPDLLTQARAGIDDLARVGASAVAALASYKESSGGVAFLYAYAFAYTDKMRDAIAPRPGLARDAMCTEAVSNIGMVSQSAAPTKQSRSIKDLIK